jgi:hypothetical protein
MHVVGIMYLHPQQNNDPNLMLIVRTEVRCSILRQGWHQRRRTLGRRVSVKARECIALGRA